MIGIKTYNSVKNLIAAFKCNQNQDPKFHNHLHHQLVLSYYLYLKYQIISYHTLSNLRFLTLPF